MRKRLPFLAEKNRVLVPVGKPCTFGCRYCYTRGKEVGLLHVSADTILADFQHFAETASFETIQFGYDSDPFSEPGRGLVMLKQLTRMHKDVNFSTKALLEGSVLEALSTMRREMEVDQTRLSALVSLSCWDSAAIVEPHTPSPLERMRTVANLKRIGVPVFIAVRPILPNIADSEYERIADEGIRAGCDGFVLGPLYADAAGRFVRFIPAAILSAVPGRTDRVAWSPHAPLWTRYEDNDRLQRLLKMIQQKGGRTFLSSAEAMALVHRKESIV